MKNLLIFLLITLSVASLSADRLILNFENGNVGRVDTALLEEITFTEPGIAYLCITLRDGGENYYALADIEFLDFVDDPTATLRLHLLSGSTDEYIFKTIMDLSFFDPSPIDDGTMQPSGALTVLGNHPNPFNPDTDILLSLVSQVTVKADIYDVRGAHVRHLMDGTLPAGEQRIHWNGCNDQSRQMPSGVYFYRITADGMSTTGKMLLLK